MSISNHTGIVQSDLDELRELMVTLPTAVPGSAHCELTIQLIRQLLKRVALTIKREPFFSSAELDRKLIQDWFDDTLRERGLVE